MTVTRTVSVCAEHLSFKKLKGSIQAMLASQSHKPVKFSFFYIKYRYAKTYT